MILDFEQILCQILNIVFPCALSGVASISGAEVRKLGTSVMLSYKELRHFSATVESPLIIIVHDELTWFSLFCGQPGLRFCNQNWKLCSDVSVTFEWILEICQVKFMYLSVGNSLFSFGPVPTLQDRLYFWCWY